MSKVHIFQRYHQKENVTTNNTMLLLARIREENINVFNQILADMLSVSDADSLDLQFSMQERLKLSIPDGVIMQPSINITIETKLDGKFRMGQLRGHLDNFNNENHMILMTLDKSEMTDADYDTIYQMIQIKNPKINHVHLSFAKLIKLISKYISERDYELKRLIDDYKAFIIESNLYADVDQTMLAVPVGSTFDYVLSHHIYHRKKETESVDFRYLALYRDKSIRAIGKLTYVFELGSDNLLKQIYPTTMLESDALLDLKDSIANDIREHKIDLENDGTTRFYFIDDWVRTDFKSANGSWLQNKRYFNLNDNIKSNETWESDILNLLDKKPCWEDFS